MSEEGFAHYMEDRYGDLQDRMPALYKLVYEIEHGAKVGMEPKTPPWKSVSSQVTASQRINRRDR